MVPCGFTRSGEFEFEPDDRALLVAHDGALGESLFVNGRTVTSFGDHIDVSPEQDVMHFGAVSREGVFSGWSEEFAIEWPNEGCTSSQRYGLMLGACPLLFFGRRKRAAGS